MDPVIDTEDEVLNAEAEAGDTTPEPDLPEADGEGQAPAADEGDGTAVEAQAESGEDELVISIGEESPEPVEEDPALNTPAIRQIRQAHKETTRALRALERENRELKQRMTAPANEPQAAVLGEKPTMAGANYDEEKFEADLEAWHTRKREIEEQERTKANAQKAAKDAWENRLNDYGKAKAALKVKDFEDAEEVARDMLSVTQQGVIINGADNPAVLVYALGRNPKKAKELAAITDPVKFAFAVAKLETQLKVTPRKAAPVPERQIRGSATLPAVGAAQLEALRVKAQQTGDYDAYYAAKRRAQG